jgi:hypothetical protein
VAQVTQAWQQFVFSNKKKEKIVNKNWKDVPKEEKQQTRAAIMSACPRGFGFRAEARKWADKLEQAGYTVNELTIDAYLRSGLKTLENGGTLKTGDTDIFARIVKPATVVLDSGAVLRQEIAKFDEAIEDARQTAADATARSTSLQKQRLDLIVSRKKDLEALLSVSDALQMTLA